MIKGLKITLIILLSCIAIGLGVLLFILINNDFKFDSFINIFGGPSNKLIESKEYDTVENIYINSNAADIYIKNSEDNKIKVELYSDNVKNHSISLSNNDLKVELNEKHKFRLFGKHARIVLYVPSNYSNKFDISNSSGDIRAYDYENASFIVNVTSGDVRIDKANTLDITTRSGDIKNSIVNTIKVKCTSGDIRLGEVNKKLNLKTTSGDIRIDKINLSENSNIEATSGDIKISNKNNVYVETKTKFGDVNVKNNDRFAKITLNIKVTSGDIKVG